MRSLFLFLAISFFAGCEPECEECYECEAIDGLTVVQTAIVNAAEGGAIVEARPTGDGLIEIAGVAGLDVVAGFEFNSLLHVSESKLALDTCPAFPSLPPEYDWFCVQTGEDGRFIGYDVPNPTVNDVVVYEEYPSEENPDPMTFKIYYSSDIYGAHQGTNSNYHAHRNWMKTHGWENAQVDFCAKNNPNGHPHCEQE
jgi:hypothetical protein